MQNIVVFEQHPEDLGTLALTRPVYGLRVGMSTLAEKIVAHYQSADYHFLAREYLAPTVPQIIYFQDFWQLHHPVLNNLGRVKEKGALFIDGAVIASLSEMPESVGENEIGIVRELIEEVGKPPITRDRVAYARLNAETYQRLGSLDALLNDPGSTGIPVKDATRSEDGSHGITVATFPWHLVMNNGKAIEAEYSRLTKPKYEVPAGVLFSGEKGASYISPSADICTGIIIDSSGNYGVYIGEKVEIQGHVTLDARNGPIFIDDGTVIESLSVVQGPVYIGKKNLIKQGIIREGCSFGPMCRIGGEVEETIIIGYSNKQHLGFMGHAVIGEWVNWGAGTSNSDLKNDYSMVEVQLDNSRKINTGQKKTIGCYIGDHTKTGLNTSLNTGTVIGVMSNVLMTQVTQDKLIPNFCLYNNGVMLPNIGASKTAAVVMERRGVKLTPEHKAMLDHLALQFKAELREIRREKGGRR